MHLRTDAAYATELDAADALACFRDAFVADDDLIYLDGNSLGRSPHATRARAEAVVRHEWGERLIRGWNESWFDAPTRIAAKLARVVGCDPDEIIMADTTSVNLFKLVVAALRFKQGRTRILSDTLNFPSDIYILQGVVDLLGNAHCIELVPSDDGIHGPVEQLEAQLDKDVALLTLSHTVFKSGYTYDMARLTRSAQAAGALVLWDLSHSVGALPIELSACGVDLAVGCTYKYLNGGPGAPAFLYVRRELQEQLRNPIAGWMGQQNLFGFDLDYTPATGMRRWLSGTPHVVSLALVEPGLDLLLEAGMERLRAKSLAQSEYLIGLWQELLAPLGFSLNSPRHAARRGSHISLGHPEGLRIDLALINDMGVLPDFRAPDNIRLGIAPLYNSFRDIHAAVECMRRVVVEGMYERYASEAPTVT